MEAEFWKSVKDAERCGFQIPIGNSGRANTYCTLKKGHTGPHSAPCPSCPMMGEPNPSIVTKAGIKPESMNDGNGPFVPLTP